MSSYLPLFLALMGRTGYSYEISEPRFINGSATPPPSRRYPGLTCYMVTITVKGVEYHGFGPNKGLARQYAAYEACKALRLLAMKKSTGSMSTTQEQNGEPLIDFINHDGPSVCSEPSLGAKSIECMVDSLSLDSDEDTKSSGSENQCYKKADPIKRNYHGVPPSTSTGTGLHVHNELKHDKNVARADGAMCNVSQDMTSVEVITDNPVGQLQQVFRREFQTLPTFTESVHVSGGSTEFICTIKVEGLTGQGVGRSKKLARRQASEHLLSLMRTKGININPSKKQKVIKKSNVSDRKQFDPGHGVSSSPDYGQPHFRQLRRSSSCGSLRTKACKGSYFPRSTHPNNYLRSTQIYSDFRHHQFSQPLRSISSPQPSPHHSSPRPQSSFSSPLSQPPPFSRRPRPFHFSPLPSPPLSFSRPQPPLSSSRPRLPLPPPCVPTTMTVSDGDSDSDSDCKCISDGLCEVIPPQLQSSSVHNTERSMSSSPVASRAHNAPSSSLCGYDIHNSVPSPPLGSHDLRYNETISNDTCSSISHSGPVRVTAPRPCPVGKLRSSSIAPLKALPWEEIRRESQIQSPSTDYIYHRTVKKYDKHTEQSVADLIKPAKNLLPRHTKVGAEAPYLNSSCLPAHPLFWSVPMVQRPFGRQSIKHSEMEDNVDSYSLRSPCECDYDSCDLGESTSEYGDVVLTSDISVGLPSEGAVRAP